VLTDCYKSVSGSQASVGGSFKTCCISRCGTCSKHWHHPRWCFTAIV